MRKVVVPVIGASTLPAVATRVATRFDEIFLRSLFAEAHEALQLLDMDVRDLLLDMQYRERCRELATRHPAAEQVIIVADGKDVGTMTVDRASGVTEILDLTVARTARGRGISVAALDRLHAADHAPMAATVRAQDTVARHVLTRAGFQVADEQQGRITLRCA